jgi:hypothetical protein
MYQSKKLNGDLVDHSSGQTNCIGFEWNVIPHKYGRNIVGAYKWKDLDYANMDVKSE